MNIYNMIRQLIKKSSGVQIIYQFTGAGNQYVQGVHPVTQFQVLILY